MHHRRHSIGLVILKLERLAASGSSTGMKVHIEMKLPPQVGCQQHVITRLQWMQHTMGKYCFRMSTTAAAAFRMPECVR